MFDSEFFPTPYSVARKMISKISRDAIYILEPSAGKGDIADALDKDSRYRRYKVDCIEQSPELCAILRDKGYSVVGNDFLDYNGVSYYSAILMNPPFSNGDKHLLKAWDFLHDGEIVCLLNEETIKNPYSVDRKRLLDIINKNGNVEYIGDCFSTAERKTNVNIAMVYLKKVSEDDAVDLWETNKSENEIRDDFKEDNMLAIQDNLGNMQRYYDQANIHMIQAFQHLRKAQTYMAANGVSIYEMDKILSMAMSNMNNARAEFMIQHRNKAWHEVFNKMDFDKWLDKKQRQQFIRDINTNGNIPFTKENIKGTLRNVFEQRQMLFEKSVANVFDELTRYYPENSNYKEGWKSNSNFKVNQKLVFPYGCTFDSKFTEKFSLRYDGAVDVYKDLDRILCNLTGIDFEKCLTIYEALDIKFKELGYRVKGKFDNKCESRFFFITFYKKGTVHLTFKEKEHWELFNKTAAKGKAWLGHE
jgi:hypothetical protein